MHMKKLAMILLASALLALSIGALSSCGKSADAVIKDDMTRQLDGVKKMDGDFANSLVWLLGEDVSAPEIVCACDTWQFTDYSKYDVPMFNVEKKEEQREKQFPIDLQNAFDMGKRLCEA